MAGAVLYDGPILSGAIAAVLVSGAYLCTIPYANGMRVLILRSGL